MKRIIVFLIITVVTIYVSCHIAFNGLSKEKIFNEENLKQAYYEDKEAALLNFITEYFIGKNGEIFTNIRRSQHSFDTLSESVGLLMNYSVMKNRKDMFDMEYEFLKKHMMTESGFIKWRYGDEPAYCNALIDDLRIARALMDGYNLWDNEEYMDTAQLIQRAIYQKQAFEGYIYEFYDWRQNSAGKRVPLCYLDIHTIGRFSLFNEGWGEILGKARETLQKGRINEKNPFFNKYYRYDNASYLRDEEYAGNKEICLTYTLYTAIHMAEANEDTTVFAGWLLNEIKKGKVYAWYNPDTLKNSRGMESTAVYALGAVYADKIGERELFKALLGKMLEFMVVNEKSPYYGGFGIEETREFYSFDNLTALWALSLAEDD